MRRTYSNDGVGIEWEMADPLRSIAVESLRAAMKLPWEALDTWCCMHDVRSVKITDGNHVRTGRQPKPWLTREQAEDGPSPWTMGTPGNWRIRPYDGPAGNATNATKADHRHGSLVATKTSTGNVPITITLPRKSYETPKVMTVRLGSEAGEHVAETGKVRAEIDKIVKTIGVAALTKAEGPSMTRALEGQRLELLARVRDLDADNAALRTSLRTAADEIRQRDAELARFSAALIEAQRVIAGLRGVAEPVERGAGLTTVHGGIVARVGR